ncbi:hypothetical protein MTO96_028076 [Rhipicephalus appendiculatus]
MTRLAAWKCAFAAAQCLCLLQCVLPFTNGFSFWKMLETLPHTALMYNIVDDPSLMCATALRTDYNVSAETGTYRVHLAGLNGTQEQYLNYVYTAAVPADPAAATLVIDEDVDNVLLMMTPYTDYETCFLGVIRSYDSDVLSDCMLWVNLPFLDAVPQRCTEAFKHFCRRTYLQYNKDVCYF